MNEFFSVKISSRFVFVSLLPTLFLVVLVGGLIAAGAPTDAPSWGALVNSLKGLGWVGAFLAAFGVVVTSFVAHPLTYPLVQLAEGYWISLPFGRFAQWIASERYRRWCNYLEDLKECNPTDQIVSELYWYDLSDILPTRLGNVLRAGEVRAGRRYGYDTSVVLLKLYPFMSPVVDAEVSDTRNQLDTVARLCVMSLLAVPVTLFLLWSHGLWLLVPVACYLFAWAAYRASIAAAMRFCEAISMAFDLHRLQLWDALSLRRPGSLKEERRLAELLCIVLNGADELPLDKLPLFEYLATTEDAPRPQQVSEKSATPLLGRGRRWLIRRLGGSV